MRPILDVANHHKCKYLEKFPEKYMTWQAIWSCGRRPDIFIAKGTMTADVYLKECLQKIILPLIWEHRAPEIFWTDLTTAHYARKVLDWFQTEGLSIVPKHLNPPNCPEIRPIERYWAIIKRKLLEDMKSIKTLSGLRRKWLRACAEMTDAAFNERN